MIAPKNLKVPAVPFWQTGTFPNDNPNTFKLTLRLQFYTRERAEENVAFEDFFIPK